jgi:SSS family solute:Na+ symporter
MKAGMKMAVDTLTFAFIALIYLVIVLALGYLGYKQTRQAEDYMLAGRKVHPALIAISYGATFISTSAIVGFGGQAGYMGMGLIWLTFLNIAVGILLAFVVFGKKTREIGSKLKAVTFPDLMGKIYKSSFLQYVCGFVIVVGMPLYAAAVITGAGRFIETTFAIDYNMALLLFAIITAVYVIMGGLLAVIYTDTFQGLIMLVGMTILLVFTFVSVGGITPGFQALSDLASKAPASLIQTGFNGWTAMPTLGSPLWFSMITSIVMGVGIGVLAQPQLVVRFMTAKDNKSLNRAVPIGGFFILMMTGVAFTVGALSNVYFQQTLGKTAMAAAGNNVDSIIPAYINAAMPDWFVIIFMLTLLAAAMSTLSALFHTMGTAIGNDVWGRWKNQKPSILINRASVLVMLIISVAVAYIMPTSFIAAATALFMGLCAAAFLPAFVHALYSKRPSLMAAKSSLVVGSLVWLFWAVFVHAKYAGIVGLAKLIFGTNLLGAPWQTIDPFIPGLILSTITMVAVWSLDRRPEIKEEVTVKQANT